MRQGFALCGIKDKFVLIILSWDLTKIKPSKEAGVPLTLSNPVLFRIRLLLEMSLLDQAGGWWVLSSETSIQMTGEQLTKLMLDVSLLKLTEKISLKVGLKFHRDLSICLRPVTSRLRGINLYSREIRFPFFMTAVWFKVSQCCMLLKRAIILSRVIQTNIMV